MDLSARDQQILRLCYEQQFLLSEHVEEVFQSEGHFRRLRQLEEAGYIVREPHPATHRRSVIRLTTLGTQSARMGCSWELPKRRRTNVVTLAHDAIVTSARLRLASVWPEARFIPERAIRAKDFGRVPDGIFSFASGSSIALEVENSAKGVKRFLRLLKRWQKVPEVVFVLYVATSPELEKFVRRGLARGPAEQPMGAVLWEALRSGLPRVWTPQGEVDLFSRREY